MNQVAFILENTTIYWHSIVLALSVLTGICFFMACCCHLRISSIQSSATVLTALVLLAIDFAATSIIGAIISGALLGFFALVITAAACFTKCVSGCGD